MDEPNYSLQLAVEEALKGFIPALQALDDPDGDFDFLNVFPSNILYLSFARRDVLPEAEPDFLSVIAELPKWINARHTIGDLSTRFELGTGGMKEAANVAANTTKHSQRIGALLQLFSRPYLQVTLPQLRAFAPKLIWHGYDWQKSEDGPSPSGNQLIAKPTYLFRVSWATS